MTPKRFGLALGSGAARGWAHIGLLRELLSAGIQPHVVCGTSIGALVGAAYVNDSLDALEDWVKHLTRRDIVRYMDIELFGRGGLATMERLLDFLRTLLGDVQVEQLQKTFAAVATDIRSGREVWLQHGSLLDAVRASAALPGLFTPVRHGDQWLVDGGLVNPVPVSVCRALGADIVIAADLNTGLMGKHSAARDRIPESDEAALPSAPGGLAGQITASLRRGTDSLIGQLRRTHPEMPHLFEVLAGSLNVMQDRITRSRMAGDPPDILLMPRLRHLALLEFDRATEAIEEGRQSVARMLPAIEFLLASLDSPGEPPR
ncbi:MAG: patatin-like phospholipase RssA [Gammaproteobacteria bacterium]|nr:patatin-like phospholipase RssA [Gammaproteobacteria bacterium]